MCELTAEITKICGPNPPGIVEVVLNNIKDVTTIPPIDDIPNHTISTDIVLSAKFFKVGYTEETGMFDEELVGETDAQSVKKTLPITIPGISPSNVAIIDEMVGGRYVAIVTYVNGDRRIVGNKTNPLRLSKVAAKSGKFGSNDRKGVEMELNTSDFEFSPFYTGVYDATIIA